MGGGKLLPVGIAHGGWPILCHAGFGFISHFAGRVVGRPGSTATRFDIFCVLSQRAIAGRTGGCSPDGTLHCRPGEIALKSSRAARSVRQLAHRWLTAWFGRGAGGKVERHRGRLGPCFGRHRRQTSLAGLQFDVY
jgi:hypothetical protein